jgi:hypothetical protein
VAVGSTLIIDANTPSIGIDPCRTIWNIYPVSIDGLYTAGPITVSRDTQQALKGFVLAPHGWLYFILQIFGIGHPSNCKVLFQLPFWMVLLEISLDYWCQTTTSECKVSERVPRISRLTIFLPTSWQLSNVDLLDFSSASGGVCKSFLGCVPYQNATSTSVSPSSTVTSTMSSNSGKFVDIKS